MLGYWGDRKKEAVDAEAWMHRGSTSGEYRPGDASIARDIESGAIRF
jgi:hypothetical protein